MAERKHTPGPWTVSGVRRKIGGMDCVRITREADGGEIGYVQQTETLTKGWAPGLVDAKLMAAAPELLEALREANAFILAPAEDIKDDVLSRIRNAIWKAVEV